MGHVRLKTLPKTRYWGQVVELLDEGATVTEIATASARAADKALSNAASDPALRHVVWLLTQLPAAARDPNFVDSLNTLGIHTRAAPSLMGLLAGFERAVDIEARRSGGRTDLGEMAQLAAAASLTRGIAPDLPSLFGTTAADVQSAIAKLGSRDRFASLSRNFFANLIQRSLEYYLSRAYASHVGPGEAFASINDQAEFRRALEVHCHETALIVERYAGEWFSKSNFEGGITPAKAEEFARTAFRKIRAELSHRSRTDG